MTGRRRSDRTPPGGWPGAGSWVSRLQGPVNGAVPPNLALMYATGNRTWREPGTGGFPGVANSPFNLVGREARSTNESIVLQGITRPTRCPSISFWPPFKSFSAKIKALVAQRVVIARMLSFLPGHE